MKILSIKLSFLSLLFFCVQLTAVSQTSDTTKWITNGTVRNVYQYGNRIHIAGEFDYMGPVTLGSVLLDSSNGQVQSFPEVFGSVSAVISDGSGGWYMGGTFTKVGSQLKRNIVHILPDFSVDPDFSFSTDHNVDAMVKSGNTIYIGGAFTIAAGQSRSRIAAINATTGALLPWNPLVNSRVRSLVVIGNTIYIGGHFSQINSQSKVNLGAIDATTGTLLSWNPVVGGYVTSLAVSGNTIYAGGYNTLVAIDATTGAIASWNSNLQPSAGYVNALEISGGILYVGGYFSSLGGQPRNNLAAINLSTGAATSWNPKPDFEVFVIKFWHNLIYVGGNFTHVGGEERHRLAVLDPVSGTANAWNPNINGGGDTGNGWFHSKVYTITPMAPNRIHVGGVYESVGGMDVNYFSVLDDNTGEALVPPLTSSVGCMIGKDNLIYFTRPGSIMVLDTVSESLIPLPVNVTLPNSSIPSNPLPGAIKALLFTGDTLYIGGIFTHVNGQARTNFAAFKLPGYTLLPSTLNIGNAILGEGVSFLVKKDNTIFIGGSFETINGSARSSFAAIDHTSGTLKPMDLNIGGVSGLEQVSSIIPIGNKLYISGRFTTIGGMPRYHLACIDANTGIPNHWNPRTEGLSSTSGMIHSMSYWNGKIYVGGEFVKMDGVAIKNLAEIDTMTGAVSCWNPDLNTIYAVQAVNGKLNVGGFGLLKTSQDLMYHWRGFKQYKLLTSFPGILTSDVSGATCAGTTMTVSFTATGSFNSGNIFTAQLSDANGSFANPTSLGTTSSNSISFTIPSVPSGSRYKIRFNASNPCVIGGDTNQIVIRGQPPQPTAITGATANCIGTVNYEVTNVPGTAYAWSVTGGGAITSSNQNTATIDWTTAGNKTLTVTPSNSCGAGTPRSLNINVNTIPEQPGPISGNTTPCFGLSAYSISTIAGVTYTWSVTGGTISSSSGGNATVNWNVVGSQTLTVTPSNSCGSGTPQTLPVDVSRIPLQPGLISGNTTVCMTSENYSVNNVADVNYTWSANGGTVTSSSGNTATVNWTSSGSRSVSVTPSNFCGTGQARTLNVNVLIAPLQPGVISGNTSPCINASYNYSVASVSGVTYAWSTTGGTVSSSNTSSTITWTSTGAQTITLTPSNSCGTGTVRTLIVNVGGVPLQPSAISGNTSPCPGNVNYSVTPVAGVSYSWSATGGTILSASGGNATVNWTSGGMQTLTVTPSNICGTGPVRTLTVNVGSVPALPGSITGNTTVCLGSQNYSISALAGVTYNWTAVGGTITSSSGGNATVNWMSPGGRSITVTPANACGNGPSRSLSVTVGTVPAQPGFISGSASVCHASHNYSVTAVSGVNYTWTATEGTITSSSANNATINWTTNGTQILSVTPSNSCGDGIARQLTVTVSDVPEKPSAITGDTTPCLQNYNYAIINVLGVTYTWTVVGGSLANPNGSNVNVNWNTAGPQTLNVTPSNSCGNGSTQVRSINVISFPIADAGTDTLINMGTSVQLSGCCGTNNYSWIPVVHLSNSNISNPIASPHENISYTLNVTNSEGCSATDQVTINVDQSFRIFVPTMFSPNADGSNDEFKIYGFGIQEIRFEIYNKWGDVLFSTTDQHEIMNIGWDGAFKNVRQPAGTYVWKISGYFINGTELSYSGKKSGTVLLTR